MKKNNRIICADGFSMSVQASSHNYCEPRIDNASAYEEVEVGFPSSHEPLLQKYAEDPDRLTETIYGWVPSHIVATVLAKHGGIVSGQLPPGIPFLEA